jgi:hypothetical protein
VWRSLALIPFLSIYSLSSCQADALRGTASRFDSRADALDGGQDDELDIDLGDYLADLVGGL